MLNLTKLIFEKTGQCLNKPAVIFGGKAFTYKELSHMVNKYAGLLNWLGVKKGDRVALQLPKCMEFIFLHLANLALGAITLPLNPAFNQKEVEYLLDDSGSSLFFVDRHILKAGRFDLANKSNIKVIVRGGNSSDGLSTLLRTMQKNKKSTSPFYRTEPDDVALLCYTSGTTGKPKGAMITHRNLVTNTSALQKAWRWTEQDILLHVLPLFHIHGLCVALHGGLYAGSTVIIHEQFDPVKSLKTIEKTRSTMFMAVPTIYYRLINAWRESNADLSSMRIFFSGSGPLSKELFEEFYSATGFRIMERYGMTEAQMITTNPYNPEKRIPGSVGYPLPGVKIRIVSESGMDVNPGEIGEVWIKGENVFKGYWNMHLETRETFFEGWLRSGDLGFQDENDEMRLYLAGRSKELIITGGYNVYPKEVEDVLNQHKAVQEAVAVGITDPEFGEKVVAAVVLKVGFSPVLEEDIVLFCKKRLVSYKCPKQILYFETLPKNAMGKIQKHLIIDKMNRGS